MAMATAVALIGFLLAWWFYHSQARSRRSSLADSLSGAVPAYSRENILWTNSTPP